MKPNTIISIVTHEMYEPWEDTLGLHQFESSFVGTAIEKEHSGREMECSRVIILYPPSAYTNTTKW